ncbi:MAG TPA: FAD-dependent oxidoreductase [Vicinamibacterales bacterium]|nr:FAD-dependent oxidoreductase [Vicinamibacterales bacterium]
MDRRNLLRLGGMAALGFSLEACAPRTAKPALTPSRPMLRLPLVNVSFDRVIRTTIGLRPHRPSGFVLKADKLDGKTIIHNFGHGGAGMSLSWGTASMATDMAMAHTERKAAVMGSGVVGLTSARELQRHGFDVTIYAATVPPDTTSNMSLAGFTPTSGLVDFQKRTPEWEAQFRQAVRIAYRRLQLMAGPKYGITWINNYAPTNNEQAGRGTNMLMPEDLQGARVILGPGEHPFPMKYAIERPEMRIEPSIYLDALMDDFLAWGGKVVIRKFETPRDVTALSENVIVNCTGLGAKALFNDPELMPLKGQLVVLTPQHEINYSTSGGARPPATPDAGFVHMMPRSDGIVLGGTSIRDNWSLDIEEADRKRIVEAHIELFDSMRGAART